MEMEDTLDEMYLEAKRVSEDIAAAVEPPRFYREKAREVELSRRLLDSHPIAQAALRVVERYDTRMGHGISHVMKVAVDAGALILIESAGMTPVEMRDRLVLLAHIAGILHDIKRSEPNHASRGAEEAGRIMLSYDLSEKEKEAIVKAIGNHEAFRTPEAMRSPQSQLLSDALYDADKFRWGPDNFTETVWLMVSPHKIPLKVLLEHFLPSLEGIGKIRETFRTATGKEYGPNFIDCGLEIGMRLYAELSGRKWEE